MRKIKCREVFLTAEKKEKQGEKKEMERMTARVSFCFLLFLTGSCDCALSRTISQDMTYLQGNKYCHVCTNHTMCLFPYDTDGVRCVKLEHADLDEMDINAILNWHNSYRESVAQGKEQRGNPGPQSPAKYMMELFWDDELAHIARRWVVQCNLFEKDQCRDVEQFGVWQNVHVLDINSVGNGTSITRLHYHIQSWYDEVEDFDSAEIGLVNLNSRRNLSYIPFGSSNIRKIGCGRAIYTAKPDPSMKVNIFSRGNRVETLVCNYGPLDRNLRNGLYEVGVPGHCPMGMTQSPRYPSLCRNSQEWRSQDARRKFPEKKEKGNDKTVNHSDSNQANQSIESIILYPLHFILIYYYF